MGHENIEMKNSNAAIACYRQATGIKPFEHIILPIDYSRFPLCIRDEHAWFQGLVRVRTKIFIYIYVYNKPSFAGRLGQAYEILKMPLYSLYYYRMAQSLKPDDSRMLVALGDAYDKLDRLHDAKKCYWKAHCVGDLECIALLRLAK